jgi:rhomboid family GlyGly-CTERM serine protease
MASKTSNNHNIELNGHPIHRSAPWLTLTMSALALLLYLGAGPAAPALIFDRVAVTHGQWWRLVTGHLIHCDLSHLGWDVAGLLILGWLFEDRFSRARFLTVMASGMLAVNAWLWWGQAPLRYCGLSGLLNTLLAAGLIQQWRNSRSGLAVAVGFAASLKIALECLHDQALFTATAWPSVPQAHAAGLWAGIVISLVWWNQLLFSTFREKVDNYRP